MQRPTQLMTDGSGVCIPTSIPVSFLGEEGGYSSLFRTDARHNLEMVVEKRLNIAPALHRIPGLHILSGYEPFETTLLSIELFGFS